MTKKFSSEYQPERRRGKAQLPQKFKKEALEKLEDALLASESWAVKEVLDRFYPKFKQSTDPTSIDAKALEAKILEVYELKDRLEALEDASK